MLEEKSCSRRRSGRWIAAVLAVLVVAGAAAAGGYAYYRTRTIPLSSEELEQWEERLNSPQWCGFSLHLYSDLTHLNLDQLLRGGGGPVREPTAEEKAAFLAAGGTQEAGMRCLAVSEAELDSFLLEMTGQPLATWRDTLSDWTYLPDSGTYCRADTPPEERTSLTVTAGTRTGDTLVLSLSRSGVPAAVGVTVLTVKDGKVQSHTNDQYNAVEAMALELINQQRHALEEAGAVVKASYLSRLQCVDWRDDGYYLWALDCRILPEDRNTVPSLGSITTYNGWLSAEDERGVPLFIVKSDDSGRFVLMDTLYTKEMTVADWNQYVDYVLELGMTVDLSSGWPAATASLLRSISAGNDGWATQMEGVVSGYLLSYGDTLENWEILSETQAADSGHITEYALVSATPEGQNRQYTLLLGRGLYTDTQDVRPLSLWQVVGCRSDGAPLAQQRAGNGRSQTMELAVGEETMLCYLAEGGGSYGDYAWSLYLPESWKQDGTRWYPDSSRLNAYLEVRPHDSGYTAAAFYTSFVDAYTQVETNYRWGGTTAWAKGYSGRHQLTEAYWFETETGGYEVMWTYPDGSGLTGLFTAVAQTFQADGSDVPMDLGERPQEPLVIYRTAADPADTWLVLDNLTAWRLSDFYAPYLEQTGYDAALTDTRWVCTLPGSGGTSIELFFDNARQTVSPPADPDSGAYQGDDGQWYRDLPLWLAAEHDGDRILSVRIFSYPYASSPSDGLLQAMDAALSSTGWAVDGNLDPATNTITVKNP